MTPILMHCGGAKAGKDNVRSFVTFLLGWLPLDSNCSLGDLDFIESSEESKEGCHVSCEDERAEDEEKLLPLISPWRQLQQLYSAPDLVMETTEELNVRPSLAEKVSCQRESFIIFHYLRSGRSVFGQR